MTTPLRLTVGILLLAVTELSAATLYVSRGSPNPTPPYATWAGAATNIQDAVNAATIGDFVLVTNGAYAGGLAVAKPLTLLSINGARFTIIDGGGTNRCISLMDGVNLSGFTLTNGFAPNGGGLWCSSTNAYVTNCAIVGNVASNGAGAYAGTLYNCVVSSNSVDPGMYGEGAGACQSRLYNCLLSGNSAIGAQYGTGGGASYCDLYNCTVTGNSAYQSGGIAAGTMNNCIVYYNTALYYTNYYAWANNYCCTAPMPTNGVGNITNAPLFVNPSGGDFRLQSGSPCINGGNNTFVFGTTDLEGNQRVSGGTVDMGAYEFQFSEPPSIFQQPAAQTVYAGSDVAFAVASAGSLPLFWQWNFDAKTIPGATNSSLSLWAVTTNQAGDYSVVITNSFGSITSQVAVLTVLDVSPSIALQPLDQTVYAGSNVAFTAGAVGSLPLSWQWNFNGTAVPKATNATLSLQAVTTNQAGAYAAVVTNTLGSVTSHVAVLTVMPVSITLQPTNQTVPLGSNVTFTANAMGAPPLFFQWQFNGTAIPDATNSSLTLTTVTTNASGVYSVMVRNAFGSTNSAGATLSVLVPSISYVWQDSPNPTAPYNSWATAAHTIQNAVDSSAVAGSEVVVTNGIYATGGRPARDMPYVMANRVAVDVPVKVRSVNGPAVTIIQGYQVPQTTNDLASIRCVYLTDGAVLSGFTCSGGATRSWGFNAQWLDLLGAGVSCTSANAIVTNCILTGNSAFTAGGGAYSGTLNNCIVTSNSAAQGGGAAAVNQDGCVLNNCVVTGNSAYNGGGATGVTLNNCTVTGNMALPQVGGPVLAQGGGVALYCKVYNSIVVSNSAQVGTNYDGTCTMNYCCTIPLPSGGSGNIALDPLFGGYASGNLHLLSNSPCIDSGNNALISGATDLDGNPRVFDGTVDLGAYEFQSPVGPLITVQPLSQSVAAGGSAIFTVGARGSLPLFWQWQFNETAIPAATNSSLMLWAVSADQAGRYSVIVSNALGSVTSADAILTVKTPSIHYVWLDSPSPTPPYSDWATASHILQDAVDAASAGDEVLVTNGTYATGGRTVGTSMLTNRVAAEKQLIISSVNGPDVTVIQGYQVPGLTNGDAAIRCVYLRSNAVLSGFTLTNGATRQTPQGGDSEAIGGGVYCDSWNSGLVTHCKLIGNSAADSGGGAFTCGLDNCLLTGNSAANAGGGANFCALTNCTVTGNSASQGGGAAAGVLFNCIVYYNNGPDSYQQNWVATIGSMMSFSCTTPLPGPVEWQNITNAPLFVDPANGDFHLQSNSACINAGNKAAVANSTDLDSNPRIFGGTVDLGAYEFQSVTINPPVTHYVWRNSPSPVPPFTSWATAAHALQDAVDAASAGDQVLVTNGLYATGGRAVYGTMTNRVAIDKAITLQSVNGPAATVIAGAPNGANGQPGIRCAYVGTNAVLSGFTLTNGYALLDLYSPQGQLGGGAWCELSALVTNCTLSGNSARGGGGAYGGTLINCFLMGNSAATDYLYGGGGAYQATLNNCLLTGNSASGGGGASRSTLNNCTLTGNSGNLGGGVLWAALSNCIVYYNTAENYYGSTLAYSCTVPMPTNGPGNITNAPLFVDYANGDLRLQSTSPCVNAGNNASVSGPTDLEGNPRIVGGTVDMGAYEYQSPGSMISYAWLQQYGLPTDGSADDADPDGDGMNNWQEWVCGTDPSNALSVLRMLSAAPAGSNIAVSWQSVAGLNYFLERSTNLSSPFTLAITNIVGVGTNIIVVPTNIVLVATNIIGQSGATTYPDTNATGAGPFFYRVGVKYP